MGQEAGQTRLDTFLEKASRMVKPGLMVTCLLVIILSIAGSATTDSDTTAATRGIFISILVIACLAATIGVLLKVARSSGRSKYQINDKPEKKSGLVNAAFDEEKGQEAKTEKKDKEGEEAWVKNYVPYGKLPAGSPIEEVVFTNEKMNEVEEKKEDTKEEELKSEKVEETENWKENYVAYDNEKEDGKEKEDVQKKELSEDKINEDKEDKEKE